MGEQINPHRVLKSLLHRGTQWMCGFNINSK